MARKTWRPGTNRYAISQEANSGKTRRQAFAALRSMVEAGILVFKRNPTDAEKARGITNRQPLSMRYQLLALRNEISRVYSELGIVDIDPQYESEVEAEIHSTEETEAATEVEIPEEETAEEKRPIASGKRKIADELQYFLRRIREIRNYCAQRAAGGDSIDNVGMRPAQAAAKLIPAGIPADALLYAFAMHWNPDVRKDAGIRDFDLRSISKPIADGAHWLTGYISVLAENRIPVMLIGPAGTGKSHIVKQTAKHFNLPYGETPLTQGATRGDLLGRHTMAGFISAEFPTLYSGGGVFNFEEIDAADPGMLIVLNNALASTELYNSQNGEVFEKHENFIPFATANTFGTGATRDYTARESLDFATLDRWRMGRVFVPLDETIEEGMLFGRL